jgi:hypothetical protein
MNGKTESVYLQTISSRVVIECYEKVLDMCYDESCLNFYAYRPTLLALFTEPFT